MSARPIQTASSTRLSGRRERPENVGTGVPDGPRFLTDENLCFEKAKKPRFRGFFACGMFSSVAAAAKHQNQGENDDPGAAIVEDVAKAVVRVIHKASSCDIEGARHGRACCKIAGSRALTAVTPLRYHSMSAARKGALQKKEKERTAVRSFSFVSSRRQRWP